MRRKLIIILISLSVFLIGEVILARLIQAEQQRIEETNRYLALERVSTLRARVEGLLQANLLAIRQLRTEIYLNPEFDEERLRLISNSLFSDSLQTRHVAIGVDYVIQFIHPLTGNEAALGFDYRTAPEQLNSYEQALETNEITINGPVQLTQGGTALIARVPVFADGAHNIVISQVIDHERLFQQAGVMDSSELLVSIRGRNGSGREGPVIFGPNAIWQQDPVTQVINLPSGEWYIAVMPASGHWRSESGLAPWWWFFGTLLSALLALATAYILFNQQRLKRAFRTITQQARFDSLTDLPNRHYFLEQLEHYVNSCKRRNEQCALLFIDLDRFKEVNDVLGHAAGDQLLKVIAERLRISMRQDDLVARLSGDEFVLVLKNLHEPVHAQIQAEKILQFIREPITLNNQDVTIDSSIGIAIYPEDGDSADDLLKAADLAMYEAKNNGRGMAAFFSQKLRAKIEDQVRQHHELVHALNNQEFLVHYQPVIHADNGEITSVEALVRWQHPTAGLLEPAEFIQAAERNGTIRELGNKVLQQVCRDLPAFRAAGIQGRIAVNISSHQFYDQAAVETWFAIMQEHDVSPAEFIFEITESMLLPDRERQRKMLLSLHDRGIQLAIDDFGTGYSSANHLRHFPISMLKIDRSFAVGVPDDHAHSNLLAALIHMARALSVDVVVEGIESAQQVEFIRHQCADLIQGYYFAQPMALAELLQRYGKTDASNIVDLNAATKKKGGVSR